MFTAGVTLVAVVLTLYIGHIYATQELVNNLETQRREGLELRSERARLMGKVAEATKPTTIYRWAAELGLEEGGPYAAIIYVANDY